MAADNVLEEYLVKLSWVSDASSYSRFQGTLKEAGHAVESLAGGAGARLLGWQGMATGAFVSMGTALAGMIDKVAMADQNYRLFALHMYTTQNVGRELSITMRALGASLDDIIWDPELHARAIQLFKDQQAIVESMGSGFEQNMKNIRDLRFEFQRLGVVLQYGSFEVVSDVFQKLLPQFGSITGNFRNFNDWLIHNLPHAADVVSTKIVGAIREIEDIGHHVFAMFEEGGKLLIHTIGLVSGDKSLAGAKLSWESIGKAMEDAFDVLGKFILGMTALEVQVLHLANAATDFLSGNYGDAGKELDAAKSDMGTRVTQTGVGMAIGAGIGSLVPIPGGTMMGAAGGAYVGSHAKGWTDNLGSYLNSDEQKKYARTISMMASQYGVDPSLALAVASVESGFHQYDKYGKPLISNVNGSHATGIFQLQPGTASMLGVDPTIASENIAGGIRYLAMLLKKYGGEEQALEHYYGSKNPAENRAYAQKVMGEQGGVYVNTVNINMPPSAKPDSGLGDTMKTLNGFQTQKNLVQARGPHS